MFSYPGRRLGANFQLILHPLTWGRNGSSPAFGVMFGDFGVSNQGPWGDPALLNWCSGLSRAQRRLYDLLNRLVRHSTPPLDTPPRATSPRPPPPLSHQAKMKDFQQLILACVFLSWEASGCQFSAHSAPFDLGSKWQLTSVWGHIWGFWGIKPGTLG